MEGRRNEFIAPSLPFLLQRFQSESFSCSSIITVRVSERNRGGEVKKGAQEKEEGVEVGSRGEEGTWEAEEEGEKTGKEDLL